MKNYLASAVKTAVAAFGFVTIFRAKPLIELDASALVLRRLAARRRS